MYMTLPSIRRVIKVRGVGIAPERVQVRRYPPDLLMLLPFERF